MDDIIINEHITLPASAITFRFSRSSGKGGQNVNKVSTKVELLFAFAEIRCPRHIKTRMLRTLSGKLSHAGTMSIISQESRRQWQNKKSAIDKLIRLISNASIEEIQRVPTKPTRSSKVRRVEKKKIEGRRKNLRNKNISLETD